MTYLFNLCLVILFVIFHNYESKTVPKTVQKQGKHWAVLVAGSSGWYNYRHQADICHAYQILHKNGIPDEQIVVMMYDDIAYNRKNPSPGVIINHPRGHDVYAGVPKDYTRTDVTSRNFLNILTGKKEAMRGIGSGKVIESGPNDYIFVNMVDHGSYDLFAFPYDELHSRELNKQLVWMARNNKFKQMVIYMESCESGSMFENTLKNNLKIYATTASNGVESSYACYYDNRMKTYLGDVYSVKWMENSDKIDLSLETLLKQFYLVRAKTNTSHVMEYGDLRVSKDTLNEFQGNGDSSLHFIRDPLPTVPMDATPVHNVTLSILDKIGDRETYDIVLKEHKRIECQMKNIVKKFYKDESLVARNMARRRLLTNHVCYETVSRMYLHTCQRPDVGQDGYNLKQLYVLANMCQDSGAIADIIDAIEDVCLLEIHRLC